MTWYEKGRARRRRAPAGMVAVSAWYEQFFDEFYDETHREIEALSTAREVAGVVAWLDLKPGMRVLDVPCGSGRHAVALAGRGLAVTGLDLSARLLARARSRAGEDGVAVEWVQGDMRRIPWTGRFDAVVNLFNSFGYFGDHEDRLALFGMVGALRPGGRLLLDLPDRDAYVHQVPPAYWDETDTHWVLCSFRFDARTGTAVTDYTYVPKGGGVPEHRQTRVRWYTMPEVAAWLDEAGARVEAVYGDWDGSPFGADGPRMIIIARRDAGGSPSRA
ncbi:MAG TPA: methyltransferase domain-containing protein [Bacillota bacterium]